MSDWHMSDWWHTFYLAMVVTQSAMLFFSGLWLARGNRIIKKLTTELANAGKLLGEANDIIKQQQKYLAMQQGAMASGQVIWSSAGGNNVRDLPPEDRAVIREMLIDMLSQIRKGDH